MGRPGILRCPEFWTVDLVPDGVAGSMGPDRLLQMDGLGLENAAAAHDVHKPQGGRTCQNHEDGGKDEED